MQANINTGVEFIQVDAVVRRACQQQDCTDFGSVDCKKHGRIEDLGTVAYWHKNPLRRFLFAASKKFRGASVSRV